MNNFIRRLVYIARNIGPGTCHGHAGLPGVIGRCVGYLLLRCAVIFISPSNSTIHDDNTRLVLSCHRGYLRHIDILPVLNTNPSAIQP